MIDLEKCYGNVNEIFSGIQGEGRYIGYRQLFIRLSGCNLNCAYCDTKSAKDNVMVCRVEKNPGKRDFDYLANPISSKSVIDIINEMFKKSSVHHSVSITGGEPLCQTNFVRNVANELQNRNIAVMLETNGTLPDELNSVIDFIDIVSMDIKLISTSHNIDLYDKHKKFIEIASKSKLYIKIVVSGNTSINEFENAVSMISDINADIPLIIQPVTSSCEIDLAHPKLILDLQELCSNSLRNVRVIPQCHKIIGQM